MNQRCDKCGREVPPKEQMYSLRIEMFARVEPMILTKEDLAQDYAASLEELVLEMETMDVSEAEDQVHESYVFDLCTKCRNVMHRQLKERWAEEF
jgi:hypothetical protein